MMRGIDTCSRVHGLGKTIERFDELYMNLQKGGTGGGGEKRKKKKKEIEWTSDSGDRRAGQKKGTSEEKVRVKESRIESRTVIYFAIGITDVLAKFIERELRKREKDIACLVRGCHRAGRRGLFHPPPVGNVINVNQRDPSLLSQGNEE